MREIGKITDEKNCTPNKYKTDLEIFKDDYDVCIKKIWKKDE